MKFRVRGGKALSGKICISGAKNAATKMMIASLLTDEECVFINFPKIGDIEITEELLTVFGSKITHQGDSVRIRTEKIENFQALALSRRNRIPILAIGPLLARVGKVEVPFLGGDKIGARPVNLHIEALEKLGAKIEVRDHTYYAEAPGGLCGAGIHLSFPSVGATENVLLAAVLAKGKTVITGAAVEPEIIELIKMLQKMGAIIEMGVDRKIFIEGVERLHGVTHEVIADRNEVVSFACLAAATDGDIFAEGAKQDTLINFLNAFRRVGGEYEVKEGGIRFFRGRELTATSVMTAPHPGFMTDWQQPFVALLTQAKGISVMHETIYEDRFHYTDDLVVMGAKIEVGVECPKGEKCHYDGKGYRHTAIIEGPTKLIAAHTTVRDLRSGMVNLIAALIAEGESEIEGVEEIDRGYAEIDERLKRLGAEIKREN